MMTTNRPVALVTGASSGVGKAAAIALAEAGFEVAGTSRNTAKVTPVDGVRFLDLDVASDASVHAAVGQVIERSGRIDVLVNNAGVGAAGAAEESSVAQDQRVFDVNVFGVIRMTKAVLPHMRARGSGRIINISSVLGFVPAPHRPRPGLRQADPQAQPAGRLTPAPQLRQQGTPSGAAFPQDAGIPDPLCRRPDH